MGFNFSFFLLDFKWQIQLRTNKARMKEMSNDEDLFKVYFMKLKRILKDSGLILVIKVVRMAPV